MKSLVCLFSILCWSAGPARSAPVDPIQLLDAIDQLHRAQSSHARVKMVIETPDWTRELQMEAWSQGTEKTLIRINAPKKDAGVSTLRLGDNMWNYFPKINKVMKVPPSMMMGSWMGSDFTNDDLVRQTRLSEEYQVKLQTSEAEHLLTLEPKQNTATVWGRIEIRVHKETLLPLEESFYDEKGVKVRQLVFGDIRTFGARKLPAKLEVLSLTKKGHKTTIIYEDLQFDVEILDSLFTLRQLRKPKR